MDHNIFQKIVLEEFNYLSTKYNFECIELIPWFIKFQSELVFVNIYYDSMQSYELTCNIGRLDDYHHSLSLPFDLGELLRAKCCSDRKIYSAVQVTKQSSFKKFIKILANELKDFGHDFLLGSDEDVTLIADLRKKESEKYRIENELKFARNKANLAWKEKNYKEFRQILKPYELYLSHVEKEKLNYIEKHI